MPGSDRSSEDPPASITIWFEQLRDGDPDAAHKLWDRFFEKLVGYARTRQSQVNPLKSKKIANVNVTIGRTPIKMRGLSF